MIFTIFVSNDNKPRTEKYITFDKTKWTGLQKIRKSVKFIAITDKTIENHQLCDRYFKDRVI